MFHYNMNDDIFISEKIPYNDLNEITNINVKMSVNGKNNEKMLILCK